MTARGRALLGIGGLFALVGIGWLVNREPIRLRNPRRRIVRKQRRRRREARNPRRARSLEREIDRCERSTRRAARPTTFARKADAVRAFLDVNPELFDLVESDCGRDCAAFVTWQKGGRRGPKPRARQGDGRFDPLNERWEKRTPGRKVASWKEALAVTAPSSRKWEDFGDRIPVLEEATGFRIHPPERTTAVQISRQLAERCREIEGAFPPGTVEIIPF